MSIFKGPAPPPTRRPLAAVIDDIPLEPQRRFSDAELLQGDVSDQEWYGEMLERQFEETMNDCGGSFREDFE